MTLQVIRIPWLCKYTTGVESCRGLFRERKGEAAKRRDGKSTSRSGQVVTRPCNEKAEDREA